jgi:DNA-binding response OmpR family regulator
MMTMLTSIAVVEDDADERVALGRVLNASGFTVASYASAEAYLASTAAEAACLLLDMQLEGISGMQLLRLLRSGGSTVPVIIITASDSDESRSQADALGCAAYLRKPFQGRALVTLLRAVIATPSAPAPKCNGLR